VSRKLVLDDGRAERELVVRDKLTVGRDPSCDVSDADPRLSRRHAEFQLTPKGIVVRDLDSRNGVRVNGRTVRESLLSPGDLIEVAHLSIRFLDDGKSDAVTQAMSGIQPRPVEGVQVKDGFEDDRTRVLPVSAISTTPSGPVPEPKTPTPNAAEATIRVAQPVSAPRPPLRLGVKDLFATSWGVRVLGQGALLAGVVFLITVVPMLNWFSGALGHGVSTDLLARMLAFPLLASLVAGLMVASLIARTTARGLDRDDQSQA
jgi:pSer/pThr/pTyr-binding forkhead associated (FHA) protein